jgi:hypothetical protein
MKKGGNLMLVICACYSWEILLKFGLDVSLNSCQDWKGILEKAEEVNNMMLMQQMMGLSPSFSVGAAVVYLQHDTIHFIDKRHTKKIMYVA